MTRPIDRCVHCGEPESAHHEFEAVTCRYVVASWGTTVAFATAILAANESWLDGQTPTLEELRARYPEWSLDLVTTELNVIAMYEHRELETVCGFADVASEAQGIRWLAATLAEITVEGREELSDE